MYYKELLEQVKNGDYTVVYNHHYVYRGKSFEQCLEEAINQDEKFINKYGDAPDDIIYSKKIKVGKNNKLDLGMSAIASCYRCGEYTGFYLDEDNKRILFKGEKHKGECKAKKLYDKRVLETFINVDSGNLLFRNYFEQDIIYDGDRDYNINVILERNNLMQDLGKKNVGYGQMGNMSIDIFLRNDGKEVLVSKEFIYDEDDNETVVEYENFSLIGAISLSVWRWMCSDVENLKQYNEELPDTIIETLKGEYKAFDDGDDNILLKVKPGKWKIEHYFEFGNRNENEYESVKPYSRLFLVED